MLAAERAGITAHPQKVIKADFPDARDLAPDMFAECWMFTATKATCPPYITDVGSP